MVINLSRGVQSYNKNTFWKITCGTIVLVVLLGVLAMLVYKNAVAASADGQSTSVSPTPATSGVSLPPEKVSDEPAPTPTEEQETIPEFNPYHTENTDPDNFIAYTDIMVDGVQLSGEDKYESKETIDFGYGDEYTALDGVITFRGNNFRDGGAYGLSEMTEFSLKSVWSVNTGSLTYGGETWTGSGWTGQPLIVRWPRETKANMNMYDWAKEEDIVEVIYATMDGNVYFIDLATGRKTRDTLNLGYTFKGSGALDPRGYPILYLGAGYDSAKGTSRAFIINLVDCSVMYEFGNNDPFSLRGSLSYFDGSALVDAETDRLIYPGESGILYIMKLNTKYDEKTGELSIEPSDIVKWRYNGVRTTFSSYWLGMESSPVVWRGHVFLADNGGNLMCLNLNTLELVWVQDTLDDTNSTPVLSIEDGHPYIYISTSFHLGWRSSGTADVPIWKIDAENGEIVWETPYVCYSESGVSGGVQSTMAVGQNDLEGYVYVTVARTPSITSGVLACLDRETGETVWEHKTSVYTWSSPVLVYNSDGSGYVVYCTYGDYMYLLDGQTGEALSSLNIQGGAEASPAVYEDMVVIGTRKCKIWGVELS